MEKLPDSLLLEILSRLDDSADVARCRVASKAFNIVFPGLRSINLRHTLKWYRNEHIKAFKTVFVDLILKLETVESVCISDYYGSHTKKNFVRKWLPRVSKPLKSLSISAVEKRGGTPSIVLSLISKYCHNLVHLKLKSSEMSLSMHNVNPMPKLTSLTLDGVRLKEKDLSELNRCFSSLQVLNLSLVDGPQDPKIHLLNLKTCFWLEKSNQASLSLITPNLTTLTIGCRKPVHIFIEAPMLSYMRHIDVTHTNAFWFKNIEDLKTLWLQSYPVSFMLSEFPITKTVDSGKGLKISKISNLP